MKLLTTALAFFTFTFATAQNFIDRHFDAYVDMDESTVVHVAPKSFDIASFLIPENTDESAKIKDFVGSITSLDLVAVEELSNAVDEYKRGYSILEKNFESLVDIKDKESRFGFFIDQEGDIIYEIVGIGTDEGGLFVVSVTGEMRLDMISNIINEIQTNERLKDLAPLKKYDTVAFEIYPNPANTSTELTVDVPESMIGGDIVLYDYAGNQVSSSLGVKNSPHSISTQGLAPGTFIVSLENNGVQLKKKVVVVK